MCVGRGVVGEAEAVDAIRAGLVWASFFEAILTRSTAPPPSRHTLTPPPHTAHICAPTLHPYAMAHHSQVLADPEYGRDLVRLGPPLGWTLMVIPTRPLPIAQMQE